MDFLTGAATIALIHFMAMASPGPDFAMIMRNSLTYSRRAGIMTSIGFALGASVHFTYCLLGIGLIISQSVVAFNIVKLVGAAYLIYIGVKSLKAKPVKMDDLEKGKNKTMSDVQAIRCGFVTNLLKINIPGFFYSNSASYMPPTGQVSVPVC